MGGQGFWGGNHLVGYHALGARALLSVCETNLIRNVHDHEYSIVSFSWLSAQLLRAKNKVWDRNVANPVLLGVRFLSLAVLRVMTLTQRHNFSFAWEVTSSIYIYMCVFILYIYIDRPHAFGRQIAMSRFRAHQDAGLGLRASKGLGLGGFWRLLHQ